MGRIIADAVQLLAKSNSFILIGLSFGTNIISEALALIVKPEGIVLISPTVFGGEYTVGEVFQENPNTTILFIDDYNQDATIKCIEDVSGSLQVQANSEILEDFALVKAPFRSSILKNIQAGNHSDEITLLRESELPVLVIIGEDERNIKIDYLDKAPFPLWESTIFKLPDGRHFVNLSKNPKVNELIAKYAQDQFL